MMSAQTVPNKKMYNMFYDKKFKMSHKKHLKHQNHFNDEKFNVFIIERWNSS